MSQCSSVGRKKAVICGIEYRGSEMELNGCVSDAKHMKDILERKYNFSDIYMLTDDETIFHKIPTRENIMTAMEWLVHDCRSGDSLVFFYSGHGGQNKDTSGDEIDGFDEEICPLDCDTKGTITDDVINETIVRPLPSGVTLHAFIDSCHSGTVLDLPYLCKMKRGGKYVWQSQQPKNSVWKGTMGGDVFLFSGCDDHQSSYSYDSTDLANDSIATGAMTCSFISAISDEGMHTYGSLLNLMKAMVKDFEKKTEENKMQKLYGMLERLRKKNQIPQLSSNKKFDIYEKPFYL